MKFSDEYKLTEYYQVQSTIDYITKGKNKLSAGSYGDGIFSILDIDTSVNIIKGWNWKFNKRFIPIVATAFGDLFLYCVANQYVYYFQPQYNTNDMITKNIDELFDEAFNHPSIKSGLLQEEKFKKITSLFGYLKYGEAFILKPWILLGGTDKPENYVIGNLSTYLDLVSQTLNK